MRTTLPDSQTCLAHQNVAWCQFLDQILAARKRNNFLARVDLPNEGIQAAREYLAMSGVHVGMLFPDLDGLAMHLKLRYST